MSHMHKLRVLLNSMTMPEQERFALAVGTSLNYLRKAIIVGQVLRPELCVAIEEQSGRKVTRRDLRPDDWPRIWPELRAQAAG